jgi:hypothetical protein
MQFFFLPYRTKNFITKKKYDLGRCQYQNKKALFTEPIFNDGFDALDKSGRPHSKSTKFSCYADI